MKCNWSQATIADVCSVVTDGSHNSPSSVEHGRYMVSVKDFTPYGFDFSSCRQISEDDYSLLLRAGCVPRKGDVLVGKDGARYFEDIVLYTQEEQPALLSSIAILRCKPDVVLPEYLYYLLKSPVMRQSVRDNYGSGSAIPRIVLKDFKRMPIAYPSLSLQSQIVTLPRAIDAQIRINTQQNDNLLQQSQTLFAYYATRSERQIPFASVVQVLGGGTPKTGEASFWNGEIPFFTPKDVGSPYTLTTEKSITEVGLAHCNSRLYPINTTFVTARGTVGKVSLSGVPMAMNQSCYALAPKAIDPLLVFFYTLDTVQALKHKATGAVFDAITTKDIISEMISELSEEDSQRFLSFAKPIFATILNNTFESQRLVMMRDSLLPRLMAGEIDVSSISI